MHHKAGLIVSVVLVLGALYSSLHATTIAVYTKKGVTSTQEELKSFAMRVSDGLRSAKEGAVILPSSDTLQYRYTEDSLLTGEFSVQSGIYAYFWTDQSFVLTPEFEMLGESMLFESGGDASPLQKESIQEAHPEEKVRVFRTSFKGASLKANTLYLNYSLESLARVTVELYGVNGQRFAHWTWQDSEAGDYEKILTAGQPKGMVFVRWTVGNTRVLQKIHAGQSGFMGN